MYNALCCTRKKLKCPLKHSQWSFHITIIYTKHNEGSLRYCIMFFPTLWINQCGNDLQEKKVTMKRNLEPKQERGDKGHNEDKKKVIIENDGSLNITLWLEEWRKNFGEWMMVNSRGMMWNIMMWVLYVAWRHIQPSFKVVIDLGHWLE